MLTLEIFRLFTYAILSHKNTQFASKIIWVRSHFFPQFLLRLIDSNKWNIFHFSSRTSIFAHSQQVEISIQHHTTQTEWKFPWNCSHPPPISSPRFSFYLRFPFSICSSCWSGSSMWNSATYRALSMTLGMGLISVPSSCSILCSAYLQKRERIIRCVVTMAVMWREAIQYIGLL